MAEKSLPDRTHTGFASDDEAVPDLDPTNTSGLLLERLQAWKHACGYLENYITATGKVQHAQAKEQEKILKAVSDPLKEGHHFDQSLGGVAGLFENIRANTQGIANLHVETEKNLKGSVLPILERLHAEIKNKSKELRGGADKGAKAVAAARNDTQKHIELLGQHTASFDASGGRVDTQHDPYIIQRGVNHRLNKQILEENNNRQDLIAVQNSFAQFEAHVVTTIQNALNAFNQFMSGQADRHRAMYGDIVGTAQKIPLDFEWNGFVKRNSILLVDPSAPPRTFTNISFPNQNHRATKPLIEGSLQRKSRAALKGYSAGYYAVTPAGYLHEFKDDDDFRKEPNPELSLYLPDCTIGAVDGTKFVVKGKNTSKGKIGSKIAMTHELSFKAHTPADAERWADVIRSVGGGYSGEAPAKSEPGSPVDGRKSGDFERVGAGGRVDESAYGGAQGGPQGQGPSGGTADGHVQSGGVVDSGQRAAPTSATGHYYSGPGETK